MHRRGKENQGQILFEGRDLLTLSEEEMRTQIRGEKISMIFQDPMTSLNPVATVGDQIAEAIIYHSNGQKVSQEQIDQRVGEVLEMVGIPAARKRVSSPVLWRHEAACGDCHGAVLPAGPADCR